MAWSIQLPTGEYLDVSPDLNLTFELNNQIFSSQNSAVIPGSFSFPVSLPLSGRNAMLLDHPQLVHNSRRFSSIEGVWVYAYGSPMFQGTLRIQEASASTVRVSVVVNPFESLKNLPLNELDLGGDRTITPATHFTDMRNIALAPLSHDYAYFPVHNPDFLQEDTADQRRLFQNYYDIAAGFQAAHAYPAITPFVRVDYVLRQIFAGTDYTFSNRFQITNELRRLYLYNNQSIWSTLGLPTSINLQRHVSDTKANEFLKKIMGTFCLGLFSNTWNRTVQLLPLRDVMLRPPAHDWSAYQIGTPTISSETDTVPTTFFFDPDSDPSFDYYRNGNPRFSPPTNVIDTYGTFEQFEAGASVNGTYYIINRGAYYGLRLQSIPRRYLQWQRLNPFPLEDTTDGFQIPLAPLHDYWQRGEVDLPNMPNPMPRIALRGNVSHTLAQKEYKQSGNKCPDRLMLYRGFYGGHPSDNPNSLPQTNTLPFPYGSPIPSEEYALRIDTEWGLYEKWWRPWHQALAQGKHVGMRLVMPIADIISFQMHQKVHINSMDYLVKKLRIQKLLSGGRVLVDASLVSTL